MSSNCSHCNLPACEYYLKCKTCPSILHYNCLYPAAIISKSWFHSKNPPPAYAIAIFNSPNFIFSCSSCLALNKFPSTNHTTTPPITMPYSPSTLTDKSIHNTCSKVTPNITSDIYILLLRLLISSPSIMLIPSPMIILLETFQS